MTLAPPLDSRALVLSMMRLEVESLGLVWYEAYGDILLSQAKEVGVRGGVRASKSNVNSLKIYFHPKFKRGAGLFWIVGHTYKAAEKEFTYLMEWAKRKGLFQAATTPERDAWKMTLKNGTVVETRSGEHPERLASDAPDLILVVEAGKCKPGVRKNCRQRAVEKGAQVYHSGTLEEDEDDGSQKWVWFEDLDKERWIDSEGELNGEGRGELNPELAVFSLPTWTNLALFPGGYDDPKIQGEYQYYLARDQLYTFNRKYAGIPGEVQNAIYDAIVGNSQRLISRPEGMRFMTYRGGSDYGEDHPSSLVVVGLDTRKKAGPEDNRGRWSETRDAWVLASWWTGDLDRKSGLRGDDKLINANRRRLQDAFPGLRRWVTDPLQGYMAKTWGGKKAPGNAGSREVRVGLVKGRLANMTLWFDRDGEGVAELYEEMQRVRYRITGDGERVNARERDDRTAALENAVWGLSTQIGRLPVSAKYG